MAEPRDARPKLIPAVWFKNELEEALRDAEEEIRDLPGARSGSVAALATVQRRLGPGRNIIVLQRQLVEHVLGTEAALHHTAWQQLRFARAGARPPRFSESYHGAAFFALVEFGERLELDVARLAGVFNPNPRDRCHLCGNGLVEGRIVEDGYRLHGVAFERWICESCDRERYDEAMGMLP